MSQIIVTADGLREVAGQLGIGAENINAEADGLQRKIQELNWDGRGAEAFQQLWQEWQTSQRQLHESLTGIAHLLTTAAGRYDETEDTNVSSFRS